MLENQSVRPRGGLPERKTLIVDAILEQDEGPIALRLSGQLMLGVTRIYSRKVQYLLDDCKETRERITLVSAAQIASWLGAEIRRSDRVSSICQRTR